MAENTLDMNAEITFPRYLKEPEYEKRVMYLSVYESAVLDLKFKELAAKAYEQGWEKASKELKKELDKVKLLYTLALPLPNELSDSATHDWNAEKGIAQSMVQTFAPGAAALADSVLGKLANVVNVRKPLVDPGYYQNYTGTQPRTFQFTYNLVPANTDEARDMLDMIKRLKRDTSPKQHGPIILSPHFLRIKFSNNHFNKTINMQDAVVTSIDVNYSGTGNMDTTYDGVPMHIVLTLNISERRMITQDDWEKV